MTRATLLAVLLLALLLGAWLLFTAPAPSPGAAPSARLESPTAQRLEPAAPARPDPDARARTLRERTAARDLLRRRIAEALDARDPAANQRPAASDPADASDPARARRKPTTSAADDAPASALVDRTGNRGYLARVMNQDLMPLVDECYALARETRPDLAGMLVLDVEILGDEDLGGVVDTVTPAANNALTDPDLLECVRESLLATTLPRPEQGGRDALSLSLRLEPDPTPVP